MRELILCRAGDSVRIERADGTALAFPARLVLDIDALMRLAFAGGDGLCLDPCGDGWLAVLGDREGFGVTPWGAAAALAEALRAEGAVR